MAELGWNRWLVLVTMPVHSAANLGALGLMFHWRY